MKHGRCVVCEGPLCGRGKAVTGTCYGCRMAATSFVRLWVRDLTEAGHSDAEIAEIIDIPLGAVRSRRSELRRTEAAA